MQDDFSKIIRDQLSKESNLNYFDDDTIKQLKEEGDKRVEYIDVGGYYTKFGEQIISDDEINNNNLNYNYDCWTYFVDIIK